MTAVPRALRWQLLRCGRGISLFSILFLLCSVHQGKSEQKQDQEEAIELIKSDIDDLLAERSQAESDRARLQERIALSKKIEALGLLAVASLMT